jgi:FtsP/CotA-like multicopper oxidase with cupredoxin domain
MLWYHDHAIDHTAENAYFGQAGAYILHDPAEDGLGLPGGYGVYDIPLVLSAKVRDNPASLANSVLTHIASNTTVMEVSTRLPVWMTVSSAMSFTSTVNPGHI